MSHRISTSALAAVLITVLFGGCSDAPVTRPRPAPRQATESARTLTPSSTPSAPPPRDTVSTATPRQLTGLVRIVASIGSTGHGETSTGMVLTSDGRVVTNNHAVAGATAVQATVMRTGRTYDARIVATEPKRDVAVLDLDDAAGLATVTLAQRDAVVGDRVTVVGDAKGLRYRFTAATGSVLALGQTLIAPPERLSGLTLLSCDVETGESGGPTYGAGGRVVAMTTATVPRRNGIDGVAIPVSALGAVVRGLTG